MNKNDLKNSLYDLTFSVCATVITAFLIGIIWSSCAVKEINLPSPQPSPLVKKCPKYFTNGTVFVNGLKETVPMEGKLVLESHLVAQEDNLTKFPSTTYENAKWHIRASCAKLIEKGLVKDDCSHVYNNRYVQQWTPSESGSIGQGSTGKKPPLDCEMWIVNQYWTSKTRPAMGTKYMIEANGKKVIACAGYETGPASSSFIGGAQGEVFWYLGINNTSKVKLGKIDDQSLPYGPIECE